MKTEDIIMEGKHIGDMVPKVTFHTRVRDDSIEGPNPYTWQDMTSDDYFKGKKVIVFSLPGAFTPTCSTMQLPGFEKMYEDFHAKGIDEIYCMSVNDSFVMNKWAQDQDIQNIKVIPDGNGEFTNQMGMLVKKENLGFGNRSWRYAMVVDNGKIINMFVEPNKENNHGDDPYGETAPENIMNHL